jgi:hypothetical protein
MARIDGNYKERLMQRKQQRANLNLGFYIPYTLQPGETISEDVEAIKIGENEGENASENVTQNQPENEPIFKPENEDENEDNFASDYEDDFEAIETEENKPRNIEQFEDRWEGE